MMLIIYITYPNYMDYGGIWGCPCPIKNNIIKKKKKKKEAKHKLMLENETLKIIKLQYIYTVCNAI